MSSRPAVCVSSKPAGSHFQIQFWLVRTHLEWRQQGPGLRGRGLSVSLGSTGQRGWTGLFWDIFFPQESHKMCSFQLLNAFKCTVLLGTQLYFCVCPGALLIQMPTTGSKARNVCILPLSKLYNGSHGPTRREEKNPENSSWSSYWASCSHLYKSAFCSNMPVSGLIVDLLRVFILLFNVLPGCVLALNSIWGRTSVCFLVSSPSPV